MDFGEFIFRSTLAIWPHDTPHKVGILPRSLDLFAARSPCATRKESPTQNRAPVEIRVSQEKWRKGSQKLYHHGRRGE
jgi:hypothetical protein